MKRFFYFLTGLLLLTACDSEEGNGTGGEVLPPVEISKMKTENNKVFVEVDGVPFPIYGAQIRLDAFLNCDKMSMNEVEKYFEKGKALGVNCLEVGVTWNMIEPKEDAFDFSIVDKILEYANRYGVRIELLWFSSNFIGDSFSYFVPAYILQNLNNRLYRNDDGSFWNYYGYQYALILNDKWVLERETNAITRLFNHIRGWDAGHGEKHPVITAQIHNEPDGLVRWRMDQKQFAYRNGAPLTKEAAWKMTLDALDALGKAVKNSSYKVVTRTNLIRGNGTEPYPEAPNAKPSDVLALDGIDFVSFDPYLSNIDDLAKEVSAYALLPGNYPLVAENKGTYPNTPGLMLVTSALGGGYDIYDLATSSFFIANTNAPDEIDHGVYTSGLEDKPHTEAVRTILKGLVMAAPDIARTPAEDFIAFNVEENNPLQLAEQQIQSTGVTVRFSTNNGSIGFVLDRQNYLLLYVTGDAMLQFGNGTFQEAVTGKYNEQGVFEQDGTASLDDSHSLHASGGVLYKINYTSAGKLQSTTKAYIGKTM
ncbi:MAG: DUF4969 domain-containing protein [Prolixibacteraceae bacterium]|jgi:hypothetical protein|nr:DUF4969 domain-containing protein [Prolixibacteraceae bacterium]